MAVQRLLAPYDHDGRAMEADLRRQLSAAGAEPEPEPEGPEPSVGGGRPEWVRAEVVQRFQVVREVVREVVRRWCCCRVRVGILTRDRDPTRVRVPFRDEYLLTDD